MIDPNRAAVAKLRDYSVTDLAVTGDYAARKMLLHEFGLQIDNEAAHGIAADLSTS